MGLALATITDDTIKGLGMYDQAALLRLVGLIYDAALDPDAWPVFLEELAGIMNGHVVSLSYLDQGTAPISIVSCARWDPDARRDYEQYFAQLDPWALAGAQKGLVFPGSVGLGPEVVPREELLRTEFYNDFGRRYGCTGGVAGIIMRHGTSTAAIAASHLPNREFDEADAQLIRLLLPHLRRSLQLHRRVGRLESEREATAEVFAKLPFGVILIDADGEPALINDAAASIVGEQDGLLITRGVLAASTMEDTRRLQRLISASVATTKCESLAAGGAMGLWRPSGKRPLAVLVTPLRRSNGYAPRGVATAAVFITDPEDCERTDLDTLRQVHQLTPVEARVATLLAGGLTLAEVTDSLGISEGTGRWYLKSIFSKTNVRTQAQLVRVVLTTPSARRSTPLHPVPAAAECPESSRPKA